MRKPIKSSLGTPIKSARPPWKLSICCRWGSPAAVSGLATYGDVSLCYVSYVLKHYGPGTTVVFDGYSTISPKTAEQQRRAQRVTSSDIMFDENMATTTSQAAFLSNSHNKEHLIDVVHQKMLTAGIVVKQADADADSLIVSTALALAGSSKPVVVVSTDTDILVMLGTQVVLNMDLHMLCQKNPTMLYNIQDIQDNIGNTCTYLMVIHAISGCDNRLCSVSPRQAQGIQLNPQEAWIWHAQNLQQPSQYSWWNTKRRWNIPAEALWCTKPLHFTRCISLHCIQKSNQSHLTLIIISTSSQVLQLSNIPTERTLLFRNGLGIACSQQNGVGN